mmetsp:Transcript_103336/g.274902  ORF Transcript_103336/g.274902 Transcript_103336/m.274902 type:complete len:206 (-) Transcript_103336:88-705(-)
MLANTRSRTVFGHQLKYSNEYVERSLGSPLGCFEAQIHEPRRTGDVPVIKRKTSTSRLHAATAGSSAAVPEASSPGGGQTLLRSSMSCTSLDAARGLARNAALEEEDGIWSPGRLSTSGHLAGALRRSNLRKTLLADVKDPRRPRTEDRAAALNALDVPTPAVELDCVTRSALQGGAANGLLAPTANSALLQAALADGPQDDVFL